jgi:6-phosphogluconolactonase
LQPLSSHASAETLLVYFGTYTGAKSQGIYVAEFDPEKGTLTPARLAAKTKNPTFLAVNDKTHILYAANEIADFGGTNSGAVSAFKIDVQSGSLTLLHEQPSGGSGPCHLAVARNGSCVVVANYGSGSVAVLPLDTDGRLGPPSCSVQHHGSSTNPRRQEGPHAHFVTWTPDDQRVLACDLGLDKVMVYQLSGTLSLRPNDPASFQLEPGSGPRHVAFDPSGRFVFILNELSSTLTACRYDSKTGVIVKKETVSTLPKTFSGVNTCAEVQVHPSGKTLYASNRGHNSIVVFGVDPVTGLVSVLQNISTEGKTPRHFALDPTGHWLLAENQDSDSVVTFAVDERTGKLTDTGRSESIGAPVCAVFVSKKKRSDIQ